MVDGYYADASRMFMIGKVSKEAKQLVEDTKKALEIGISSIIPYQSCIGDIGSAIENFAKAHGYSVVKEFCGHGVGLALHEDPYVLHFNHTFLSACGYKAHIVMDNSLLVQAFYFIFLLKESYTTKHGEVSCRFLQLVQFKTVF